MALLEIVTVGDANDEVLFKPASRVREFNPALHKLLDDMLDTMREAPGVGLAAPQVGVGLRVAESFGSPEGVRSWLADLRGHAESGTHGDA